MSLNLSEAIVDRKMSIYNIANLSHDALKKLVEQCISLDDVYDECNNCGRPVLLHKGSECERTVEETAEVVTKNWSDLKRRLKPILKEIREERKTETDRNVYLDGIERLVSQIQHSSNENMTTLVRSLKREGERLREDSFEEPSGNLAKVAKLTKPAKVPTWTKDLTLETFSKQLLTWSDILEDIPPYVKYADLIESLKLNKDVKGLPKFVGEHILPVLEKKTDQTIDKVLVLLDTKYGRTRTEKI